MTGSSDDIRRRVLSTLPAGWFATSAPLRDAVIGGLSDAYSDVYSYLSYSVRQTRIATATGLWLDLAARDFFGLRLRRRVSESDSVFSPRIITEILRPRVTRAAIIQTVRDLTGSTPKLFEAWNPGDCGAYDVGTLAYTGGILQTPLSGYDSSLGGYDSGALAYYSANALYGSSAGAGCYGSYDYPNQIFLKIARPPLSYLDSDDIGAGYYDASLALGGGDPGVPQFPGYDTALSGMDVGPLAYITPQTMYGVFYGSGSYASPAAGAGGALSDSEIYAQIAASVASGTIAWVALDAP